MESSDIRAYVERGWDAAQASTRDHWAGEFAARGSQATLDAASVLWQHMRTIRPGWPDDDERAADLAHHVALKRAIDRAAGAFLATR